MDTTPQDDIRHREDGGKGEFFVERDGRRVAEITYFDRDTDMVVGHTWVDPALRGGPLALNLVEAAVDYARRNGRRIVPVCSYVRSVFSRSGGYEDVWRK